MPNFAGFFAFEFTLFCLILVRRPSFYQNFGDFFLPMSFFGVFSFYVILRLGVDSWRERAGSEVRGLRDGLALRCSADASGKSAKPRGPTTLGIYTGESRLIIQLYNFLDPRVRHFMPPEDDGKRASFSDGTQSLIRESKW